MKKVVLLVMVAFFAAVNVMAQDAPKKKGNFWNKVKKGVESTTGLDVSKETLFVYPKIGEWKMELKSATGNPATGNVTVVFKVMPLAGQTSATIRMKDVVDGDGKKLVADKQWEHGANGYDVAAGTFTDCQLRRITVSPEMKSLKMILFRVGNTEGFEARDIPITWVSEKINN